MEGNRISGRRSVATLTEHAAGASVRQPRLRLRTVLVAIVLLATTLPVGASPVLAAGPANDFLAFARTLALPDSDLNVDNTLATTETGEPSPSCGSIDHSVWYRYVAATTTTLDLAVTRVNAVGNGVDIRAAAYRGTSFAGFEELDCETAFDWEGPAHLAFPVTAGETYYLHVGSAWDTGTFSVGLVDRCAPTVSVPVTRLPSGVTLGTSGVRVRTTWIGTAKCASVIDHFDVQRQTDGGAWTTIATTSATRGVWTLASGHEYRFRVRAVDGTGRISAWAYGGFVRPVAYQESSAKIAYSGTWTSITTTSAYGGRLRYARATGARATLTFTGRSVAWVSTRAPSRGYAKVYVNGVYTARINLAAASTTYRRVVWSRNWSTAATRTVRIVVEGTSGRPRVDVDAFLVLR